jgi:hypothetical protein
LSTGIKKTAPCVKEIRPLPDRRQAASKKNIKAERFIIAFIRFSEPAIIKIWVFGASLKSFFEPLAPIFHTIDSAPSTILTLVLPVFHSAFRALTDRFTAPLPEFLTVFHPIANVLPTIPPPVLSRLYALFHPQASSGGVLWGRQ